MRYQSPFGLAVVAAALATSCGGGAATTATPAPSTLAIAPTPTAQPNSMPSGSNVGTLTGHANNITDGHTIAGAAVSLGNSRTTTDVAGMYTFNDVTAGT